MKRRPNRLPLDDIHIIVYTLGSRHDLELARIEKPEGVLLENLDILEISSRWRKKNTGIRYILQKQSGVGQNH